MMEWTELLFPLSFQDKLSQLELELDEERNNSDILSERISRCREQVLVYVFLFYFMVFLAIC